MLCKYILFHFLLHFCCSEYHNWCFTCESLFIPSVLEMCHSGCYHNRYCNSNFNYQLHSLSSLMSSVPMKHENNMWNSNKRTIAASSYLKAELQLELSHALEPFKFNKEGF